jgi:hypothetical protein
MLKPLLPNSLIAPKLRKWQLTVLKLYYAKSQKHSQNQENTMHIDSVFPSKYLRATDLQNNRVTVTITNVAMEKIGNDRRAVVYFLGMEKGLILNKTNAAMLKEIANSPETADWRIEVVLYSTKVDFQGRRVDAIRIDRSSAPSSGAGLQRHGNEEVTF